MKGVKRRRGIKPDFDLEKLGINPFLGALVVPVTVMPVKGNYTVDKDGILLPSVIEIEGERMCKIFIPSPKRKAVMALSLRGQQLLWWVVFKMESGQDFLWINRPMCMEETGISSINTYRDALNDLIRNGFLSRTVVNGVYWINPSYFFSGSRPHSFPKNVKKRNKD
jgi:hypothetical protein